MKKYFLLHIISVAFYIAIPHGSTDGIIRSPLLKLLIVKGWSLCSILLIFLTYQQTVSGQLIEYLLTV